MAKRLSERKGFDLYLLIGQSNMSGRGKIKTIDRKMHPRVLTLDKDNRWVAAVDPLHFDKVSAAVGPGLTFGKAMAALDPTVVIGLVPCAVGGTPMVRWQKGADLYEAAVERARIALADGVFAGALWHQGERDSQFPADAKLYGRRLAKMVRDLRRDLSTPELAVVVAELGRFLDKKHFVKLRTINDALKRLPERVKHTAWVDSAGLEDRGDGVHLNTESQRELGRRYAEAMARLKPKG